MNVYPQYLRPFLTTPHQLLFPTLPMSAALNASFTLSAAVTSIQISHAVKQTIVVEINRGAVKCTCNVLKRPIIGIPPRRPRPRSVTAALPHETYDSNR